MVGIRVISGVAAVLGIFAVASSPAAAGIQGATVSLGKSKGLEYRKATFTSVVTQVAQPVACDGDSEATGGGGSIGGPTADAQLNESYPTLPGPNGWTVEGTAATAQDVTGFAVCAGTDTDVGTVNEDVPSGSSVTQSAFCPSGEQSATGGGVQASISGVQIGATYPPELLSDRWFGLARNTAGIQQEVVYHAVCTDAYDVRYRNSEVVNVKPGESAKASASCKPDEAVLGGGFVGYSDGLPAAGGWASSSQPKDSRKDRKSVPDDAWLVKYHNDAVVTHRLLVRAICKASDAA